MVVLSGSYWTARRRSASNAYEENAIMTQRLCFLIVFLAFTSSAWAQITEYPVTPASSPGGICRGADGGVWFTEEAGGKLGRIWTDGTVQEFVIPTSNPGPGGCADAFDEPLTPFISLKRGRSSWANSHQSLIQSPFSDQRNFQRMDDELRRKRNRLSPGWVIYG